MNDLLVEFCILTLFCCYLVHYYSGPHVSIHIKFWSVITWALNFGMILLVPIDLYQSLRNANNQQFPSSSTYQQISTEYLALYWTVYMLTWTIIPVLQQWQNSGDLQSRDRLIRSLKSNAVFYLVLLALGILGLLFLIVLDAAHGMNITTYLKAIATSFGIFLQMILMGYAMVQIPRSLWMQSNPKDYLLYCRTKVVHVEQQLHEQQFQFKKIVSAILKTKQTNTDELVFKYCTQSLRLVPPQFSNLIPRDYNYFLSQIPQAMQSNQDLQFSIENHRLLKRSIANLRRLNKTVHQFIDQAILYEDIVHCENTSSGIFQTTLFQTKNYHKFWFIKVKPNLKKIIAVIFSFFSGVILVSQTQVFLTNNISILGWVLKIDNLMAIRAISLFLIIFMSYNVYYSLFRLKISNIYGLYKYESDGPSLMFATINFSRVGAALVFNFFDMAKVDSIFIQSMNAPDMGVIGDWVIKGMPGVLWLILLSHYFNLWDRLMTSIGLGSRLNFNVHMLNLSHKVTIPSIQQRRLKLQKSIQKRGKPQEYYTDFLK